VRVFLSINPPETFRADVRKIQDLLRTKLALKDAGILNSVRWEAVAKFHITLFFIGDADSSMIGSFSSEMKSLAAQNPYGEIQLTSDRIDAFPNFRYPRVIVLKMKNENGKIFLLSEQINQRLRKFGFASDKRFDPHITLGRVKREKKINLSGIADLKMNEISFTARNFCLMESKINKNGSEYSVINEFGLVQPKN